MKDEKGCAALKADSCRVTTPIAEVKRIGGSKPSGNSFGLGAAVKEVKSHSAGEKRKV